MATLWILLPDGPLGVLQMAAFTLFFLLLLWKSAQVELRFGYRPYVLGSPREPRALLRELAFVAAAAALFLEVALHASTREERLLPGWLHRPLVDGPIADAAGAAVLAVAFALLFKAYRDLGHSWRVGVDPDEAIPLVTRGVYAWSRNPVYLFFHLYAVAAWLLNGGAVFLLIAVAVAVAAHRLILAEERSLARRFGEEFERYRARTPRYLGLPRAGPPREPRSAPPQRDRPAPRRAPLFAPRAAGAEPDPLGWWERRRVRFSLILVGAGTAGALVAAAAGLAAGGGGGSELVLLVARLTNLVLLALAANVLYTAGWLVEVALARAAGLRWRWLGPLALAGGLLLSLAFAAIRLAQVGAELAP